MKRKQDKKAFTLVELLVVIAILAILATVSVVGYTSFIKSAHISNDETYIETINRVLVLYDGGIYNERDLIDALELYEVDTESLVPQSAEYGYHFWYKYNLENGKGEIVLLRSDEIPGVSSRNVIAAIFGLPANAEDDQIDTKFAPNSPRDFGCVEGENIGYYFLDRAGSKLAEMITELESPSMTSERYNEIYSGTDLDKDADKAILDKLQGRLNTLLILNESGSHYKSDAPTGLYIAPPSSEEGYKLSNSVDLSAIGSNLPEGVEATVVIPAGVVLTTGSLKGLPADVTVQLSVTPENEEEWKKVISAEAADAGVTIKTADGQEYRFDPADGTELKKVEDDGSLSDDVIIHLEAEYGNRVQSFVITTDTNNIFLSMGNAYYIFYEKLLSYENGSFVLKADEFVGENGKSDVSSDDVTWTISDGAFSIDQNGKLSFDNEAYLASPMDTVTITATANVATESCEAKSVTVGVIRVTGLELAGNPFESKEFTAEEAAGYTYPLSITVNDNTGGNAELSALISDEYKKVEFISDNDSVATVDANGVVSFAGFGTANITAILVKDTSKSVTFTITFVEKITSITVLDVLFDGDFLYRVGNGNPVPVNKIFGILEGADTSGVTYTLNIYDASQPDNSNPGTYAPIGTNSDFTATGTFSGSALENLQIKFEKTGVAILELVAEKNGATDKQSIPVEVVDAKNILTYSDLTTNRSSSAVLLCDINMAEGGYISFSNSSFYGNGFTFDVTNGRTQGTYSSERYLIWLNNSTLDNMRIIGAVYTDYGPFTNNPKFNCSVVYTTGTSAIYNCYITNTSSPVAARGNLIISDTVLKGGCFANLVISDAQVAINNLTTINNPIDNDKATDGSTIVGLGIVFHYEDASANTTLTIDGSLTQFNDIYKPSSNDSYTINNSNINSAITAIFNMSEYTYNYDEKTWINTGILSLQEYGIVTEASIIDMRNSSEYYGQKESIKIEISAGLGGNRDCYVYMPKISSPQHPDNIDSLIDQTYDAIAPNHQFDFTDKNIVNKVEGSNDYCIYENGSIKISFDEGDTFEWDPMILSATKFNENLNYSVSMNGTDYTDSEIRFTTAGNYTIVYKLTDTYNYALDNTGNLTSYDLEYTYTVQISVSAVKPDAKNAEFTFGSGTASTTITIGNETYVMPANGGDGNATIDGTTVYYTLVEMTPSDGKYQHSGADSWHARFPIFQNVVTITDYENAGTGSAYIINDSISTMTPRLTAVASSSNGSSWENKGPELIFKYDMNPDAYSDPVKASGFWYYRCGDGLTSNERSERNLYVKYSYTDEKGSTFYYIVNYHCPAMTKSSSCVTPDTLITLADGSKKEIQNVTAEDMLLVWNHFTGNYEAVPAAIIFNHGYDYNTVIKLNFSDGTQVKAINLHQFLDVENGYVTITAENVAQYIGHSFARQDGDSYTTVTLESYEVSEEYIEAYGIISALHYNILVEDMFSTDFMPDDYNLFNYFTIGDGLVFDAEKMEEDIAKYGLYTYEEFADYLTYEQFVGFNVQYFKISVGKGYYTYEAILNLIDYYLND